MQVLVNGLISGLGIALLGMAFQCVYLPTRVFFLGMAGVYAVTPYVAAAAADRGWPWAVSLALGVVAGAGTSLLFEFANHRWLAKRQAGEGARLIASLGEYIALAQVIALVWGNNPRTLRRGPDPTTEVGGLVVSQSQWAMMAVAAAGLAGVGLLLRTTGIGLRLRALADNPRQFALFGFDVAAHRAVAFGLGGGLAAAAALATAYDRGFDPFGGLHAMLLAVVAVIVGGRGSFLGPVVGGLLLGVLRAEVVWLASPRWQEATTFLLLGLLLLVRPQGLVGGPPRLEASR